MKAFYEVYQNINRYGGTHNYFAVSGCAGFPAHFHRAAEFKFILSGKLEVQLDNDFFVLGADSAILSMPYQIHQYHPLEPTQLFTVITQPHNLPMLESVLCNFLPAQPYYVYRKEEAVFFHSAIRVLQNVAMKPLRGIVLTEHPCYPAMITAILQYHLEHAGLIAGRDSNTQIQLLQRIMLYLEAHFCDVDFSIAQAASELGVSEQYLSAIVSKRTGYTLTELLRHLRIARATHLLSTTFHSISEIAFSSGFSSIRTFNRVFFLQTGMSPSDWRSEHHLQ